MKSILPGAGWQRCRVCFARNLSQAIGTVNSKPVNALISIIFAQTSQEAIMTHCNQVTGSIRTQFPQVAAMLDAAETELTVFAAMLREHWQKIWSNKPIERLNREVKQRADVV